MADGTRTTLKVACLSSPEDTECIEKERLITQAILPLRCTDVVMVAQNDCAYLWLSERMHVHTGAQQGGLHPGDYWLGNKLLVDPICRSVLHQSLVWASGPRLHLLQHTLQVFFFHKSAIAHTCGILALKALVHNAH